MPTIGIKRIQEIVTLMDEIKNQKMTQVTLNKTEAKKHFISLAVEEYNIHWLIEKFNGIVKEIKNLERQANQLAGEISKVTLSEDCSCPIYKNFNPKNYDSSSLFGKYINEKLQPFDDETRRIKEEFKKLKEKMILANDLDECKKYWKKAKKV